MVLVEVLVLVHRVVGVHIFGIGRTLIGSGVTFSRTTAVGRVAFRGVDVLVSIQDGGAGSIEVTATEVVVVVTCWVFKDGVVGCRTDLALDGIEVVGIDAVGALIHV